MTEALTPKVLIIGAGTGGYPTAIRCGQLGLDTVIVDAGKLGGTCLNVGCIPSKAFIHAAGKFEAVRQAANGGTLGITAGEARIDLAETVRWKDGIVAKLNGGVGGLLKRAKARHVQGWATFTDAKTCTVQPGDGGEPITVTPEHVILATGSQPVELPFLPFGGDVISSEGALQLDRVPERLVVVGGGYIGVELGTAFAKFGSQVTIVEAQDRILPIYDKPLTDPVRKWLEKHGVTLHLGAKARGMAQDGGGDALAVETADGRTLKLPADKVLVTVGRRPVTQGFGLETMGVDMAGPFIKVDDQRRTSMRNVWAVGDVVGEPMLAHKSSAEGEMVAEIIAGRRRTFDPVAIAAVCFTEPEIVAAGLLPVDVEGREDVGTAQFPFSAIGRAMTMEAADDGGFVRILHRKSDGRILGIQAVGSHCSELSGEFAAYLEMGAVLEDVAGTIHVHPTLTEAFHEAALRGLGHAIHI